MNIEDIVSNFEMLDDWEDRYRYVIELGRELPPLPDDERTEENRVHGCVSQVWLAKSLTVGADGRAQLSYRGDSDAHIVRGLVAILFAIFSGKSADEIVNTDVQAILQKLGLNEHLTPQRSNGLASMVRRIKADAQAVLKTGAAPVSTQ